MFEYCGAIHVHSTYSDGSGSVPVILNAAHQSQLDFLILTDHNSLRARAEGWEGWHGKTLLIVGDEVSGRHGHCLAIGTQQRVNHRQDHQGILQDIHRQEGLSFIAHPHGKYRPLFKEHNHSWGNWAVDHFTGLELWSYMFDWVTDFRYYRFWNHYRHPNRYITGPHPQTLQKWDLICQQRPCVAIGGVDAHARKYHPTPFVVFPYESAFRTLHTRILLQKPLTGSKQEDIRAILQALKQGHCYISYDDLAQGAGVRFQTPDGQITMGDETPFQSPIEINIQLPQKADLKIICNGQTIAQHQEQNHTFQAKKPGVYRVEAQIQNSPWVYTNPIYLRAQ
ncbi:MAG: PHP domain-containing protein [Candidatus Latescibacteria bacterium]|nr:PHP domain-containing protein [Candidatus Latescibacterota bacterium]